MVSNRKIIFLSLFFMSGACGLVYEIVWSRQLIFVFGGTTFAVTTVLCSFMAGLAFGSYLAGRCSASLGKPLLIYGLLEISIGLFCLLVPSLFDFSVSIYRMFVKAGETSFALLTVVRLLITIIILIIPTTCMGATLPVLAKGFVHRDDEIGSNVAQLYGANTSGAFVGSISAGFLLIPWLGLQGSSYLAVTCNIIIGSAAILLSMEFRNMPAEMPVKQKKSIKQGGTKTIVPLDKRTLLVLYGLSGFCAMAFQIAWTRALILSLGSSTYAFSAIVACFILGLAAGSYIISIWVDKLKNNVGIAGLLEMAIGLSAMLVVPLFGEMPEFVNRLSQGTGSFEHILLLEMLSIAGLLIIPTLCMGALLPLICRIYDPRSTEISHSVGNVYASNTVGTIIGAVTAGFIFIPAKAIGMQNTIIIAAALCGFIGTVFILTESNWKRATSFIIVSVLWIAGIAIGNRVKPWSQDVMVSGPYLASREDDFDVLYYREGIDATVAVTSPRGFQGMLRALRINGKPDASNEWGDMITQTMLASIPLLLKPEAKEICNIGLGAGITAGSALAFPVEKVDVVELSAAVTEAAQFFNDSNNHLFDDHRVNIHLEDARNFLILTDYKYDLIISEPSNVWMSGIVNLYTAEFFEIVRKRLNPGGMHCQWVHSYSMKPDDFAAIIRTISTVFQYVQLWELMSTDFLILASTEQITLDVERLYRSFARYSVVKVLSTININDPMQLANFYVADNNQLNSWIRNQKIITDNLPYLEFSAPRYLLKNEHRNIIKVTSDFKGFPAIAGDPNSGLNKEFRQSIEKAANRRKYFYQANVAAVNRNLKQVMETFIQVAINGSSDARTVQSLAEEMLAYRSVVRKRTDLELVDQTAATISTIIPGFIQFQRELVGEPAEFFWPFSRKDRAEINVEVQTLIDEANRLADTGDRQTALKKADVAFRLAPHNPVVLKLMGVLTQASKQVEQAVPYLLKAYIRLPTDKELNYALSRAFSARGDRNNAIYFLEAAIEHGFEDYQRIAADSLFKPLRDDERFQKLYTHKNND